MHDTINGAMFKEMLLFGTVSIAQAQQAINDLNVFPVPDGDTGTNMSLTIQTAAQELKKIEPATVDQAASVTASALLRGARGNSGVILSLLFRGIAKELKGCKEADGAAFAAALERICTMPQADYVAYLAKLAAQAATTGTEALVFNAKDQAACGQAVADAANALLAQQGKQARLTVSPATRDLRAGFVLQQGDIEVNCAVETIAELCRSDLAAQVAEVLFGA